jgi:hypothetical protein
MRLLRDPVWRGSLVVLLRHYPAYALAVAIGCAALALSALSGRTFVDAAEIALLQGQVDAVPASAPEDRQGLVRASLFDPSSAQVEDVVGAAMDNLDGAGPPLVVRRPILYLDSTKKATPYVVNPATGDRAVGVLFNASDAVASLTPAPGSPKNDGTGLWLPDTLADRLQLGPGDPLGLLLSTPTSGPPFAGTVTGVYDTDQDGGPSGHQGLWSVLADELPTWPFFLEQSTPQIPMLVADADTYRTLARGIGERSLDTWDVVPDADPVRIDDAQRLVVAADRLEAEVRDPDSQLSQQINSQGPNEVTVFGGLPSMVAAARVGYSATIEGVAAVRVVGMGLSWLVVALAAVALLVRRRGERQVLVDQGRSALAIATLTLLEVLVPVVLGLAAGLYASRPFVEHIVGAPGTPVRPQDTALVGVAALATLVLASFGDAVQRHRRASGATAALTRRIPWRTAVVTLAGAGAVSAYAGGDDFDTATALFPLAAVGAAAIVVSALAVAGLGRLARRWLPARLGPRLTFSRLARDPSSATAFLAATVAFGAVGYGLLFQVSADNAATDKVAAQVGATSVFELAKPEDAEQLSAVADRSTMVLRTVPTVEGRTDDRLLVIDPATFGRAARWSPRFAGGRDLADVTDELATRDGDTVPVLLVGAGSDTPDTGTLSHADAFDVRYRVVDHLDAFPGLGKDDTLLVVAQGALLGHAPLSSLGDVTTQLWSGYDPDTVRRAANAVDLEPRLVETASEVRADPSLVARSWVTDYLQAFTLLALLLGLLVLVGLHHRDREQRQLQDATLADFGHPRRLASRAAGYELGVVSVLGAVAGGLAAYAVTRSLAGRLDPVPDLRPALAVTGTQQLLLAGVAFVAAALVLTLLTGRLGRARSVNELLHDE